MKSIFLGVIAFVLAVPVWGQTPVPASAKQPQPAKSAPHAAAGKAAPPPADAMLASINTKLKTAYSSYSSVILSSIRYENGKIFITFDRESADGLTAHVTASSNAADLAEARYQKEASQETYQVQFFCRWRAACWTVTEHFRPVPGEAAKTNTYSSNFSMLSIPAATEAGAKRIIDAANHFFENIDPQTWPQRPASHVSLNSAISTIQGKILRTVPDPNPQDPKTSSNVTFRYEAGRVILEADEAHTNGNFLHVRQTAAASDLEPTISQDWKDGTGAAVSFVCKMQAPCNTAIYTSSVGVVTQVRYNSLGPLIFPSQNHADQQALSASASAITDFLNAAALDDAEWAGPVPPRDAALRFAQSMLPEKFVQLSNVEAKNIVLNYVNGKLTLDWDASRTDGSPMHQHQEANLSDLDFALADWSPDPTHPGYYVDLFCKNQKLCNHAVGTDQRDYDRFGPFVIAAHDRDPQTIKALGLALRQLLRTASETDSAEPSLPTTPEATVALITSTMTSEQLDDANSVSNATLSLRDGKLVLEDDRVAGNGFAAHEEWIADPKDLGPVELAEAFGSAGNFINIYCKSGDCVSRPVKLEGLPENQNLRLVPPSSFNHLGWVVAAETASTEATVKQLELLLKTASNEPPMPTKKAKTAAAAPMQGPSVDETLAYISSQLTPAYTSEGTSLSNVAFQIQNGHAVLESDVAWPAQGITKHVSVTASGRDLDEIYVAFHKDVGYTLWINCKGGAQCVSGTPRTTAAPENSTPNDIPYKSAGLGWFVVQNAEMAGRVAKALDHLIKLSTSESEQADPFK
jgi:hypothetical protein